MKNETKQCSKCKEVKDRTLFNLASSKQDGLYPSCKECRKPLHKNYYIKNKKKIGEYRKEYRNKNRDKLKEYRKDYRERKTHLKNMKVKACEIMQAIVKEANPGEEVEAFQAIKKLCKMLK